MHAENLQTTHSDTLNSEKVNKKRSYEEFSHHGKQNVVAFCKEKRIPFIPTKLKISTNANGKAKTKELLPDFYGRPKPTDFEKRPELIEKRLERFKNYPSEYTHIGIDTREIHQIDIDCRDYSDDMAYDLKEMR